MGPQLPSQAAKHENWQEMCVLPGRGSEEEAIKEAAAEVLQGKFISQQRQTPSEQVEEDVTEGQVTKGFHKTRQQAQESILVSLLGDV